MFSCIVYTYFLAKPYCKNSRAEIALVLVGNSTLEKQTGVQTKLHICTGSRTYAGRHPPLLRNVPRSAACKQPQVRNSSLQLQRAMPWCISTNSGLLKLYVLLDNVWGDDLPSWPCPSVLFSKLNKMFYGHFDPVFFLKIMKINNFQGELPDVSAKKEALLSVPTVMVRIPFFE